MSVSNLNEFPVHDISININTIQFTVLIVGLMKFLLLHILLHRKWISSFFLGFKSQIFTCHDQKIRDNSTKNRDFEPPTKQEKKIDDQSLCRGEVEMVLKSLGIFCHGEEANKLPARLDANEIFNIFEERNPSLDEVKEAFDVFDNNRDGFIDEKELQKVLCALGLKEGLEMEKCRRMIGAFDEDGDGRIDFDEFVKFMENSFD